MILNEHPLPGAQDGVKETIQNLFGLQRILTPDAVAVRHGINTLTYRELDIKSTARAKQISAISPDRIYAGVSTTRNLDMIVSVLAILKSGKSYIPMDPVYPKERLMQMISDSQMDICISPASENNIFSSLGLKNVAELSGDDFSQHEMQAAGPLAYVLYTSGSTGKPKGVSMGQAAMVNLLLWQKKNSIATAGTKTIQFAPLSFDVSFQEIFSTLITGGELVLIDDDLRLDPNRLLEFVAAESIQRIFLPFVALQYLTEAADANGLLPDSLNEIITAGEQLKITRQLIRFFQGLPDCKLVNQYGPTECHVVSALVLTGPPESWPALPSIGKPIDGCAIYMLDEKLQPVNIGKSGELCIAGECLAEGYLNRPELSREKFVQWVHPDKGPIRIYKTGDLAKYSADGNIEFLGRKDDQVKIRGYRVEPGEIEVLLNAQKGIQQAVVIPREDSPGQLRLVAYIISSVNEKDSSALRNKLQAQVPDYMIPSVFIWMDEFPKTSSGKIDRKSLPKPDNKRPELSVLFKAPVTITEKRLATLWTELLQIDPIGINDHFFELGGNSLLAVKMVADLQLKHQLKLPVTKLYQYPTIAGVAGFLDGVNESPGTEIKSRSGERHEDIAVIAMAGRFPGANTVEELWENLKKGKETISFFSKEELDPSISAAIKNDPDYVSARGVIADADKFDASFFGINTKLADLMDPQQRIFLEICWEALESAGSLPSLYKGSIGVFAGTGNNTYYLNNVLGRRDLVEMMGAFQVMTHNEKDYVASRTSFTMNLKGPAVSVHAACSTSLVAIAQAVDSLRNNQCDIALAGGASITAPLNSGHLYQEGAMFSRDGHCRPFDANATGTVFSDGAGVVVLKKRTAAERDGDKIWALIRGIGINNDGGWKGSFTAPSAEGQAGAIRMAIEDASVDVSTIEYVEAHGTATPLGDPIEIEGLTMAFGKQEKSQFCAIGSIKSNMGHLTAAAGVAGFIKTVLALHHHQLPASLHYDKANPHIGFNQSPFYVNHELRKWESKSVRRAGVSSFGVGGTNVHVILEEYNNKIHLSDSGRPFQIVSWSAKSESGRDGYSEKLAGFIKENSTVNLADLAFTLQTTRAEFKYRRFIVASSTKMLREKLVSPPLPGESTLLEELSGDPVFVFPGQGSQYVNMGLELYRSEAVFREAVDECALILESEMKEDIRKIIFPERTGEAADEKINNTYYTQPALFVIEYALAKLWMSWGVYPTAFVGHSIGEFVAAHLSGIFSLADGLKLISTRGRLMAELEKGSMLSVRAPHESVHSILTKDISLAAINSPHLCVVAGPKAAIVLFSGKLREMNIQNKPLHTSHAFHSSMMDPIITPFRKVVESVSLNSPRITIFSTVTGKQLTEKEATDPGYWSGHLRSTVKFSNAVIEAMDNGFTTMLESGPRNVASTLVRQQGYAKMPRVVSSLEAMEGQSDYESMLKAAGQLWLAGLPMDWRAFYAGQQRNRMEAPTYAFEKIRHWVEPVQPVPMSPILPINIMQQDPVPEVPALQTSQMRKTRLIEKLKTILEEASGLEMDQMDNQSSFIEMGLDSLLLTQVSLLIKKEFSVPVSFRQLNENCGSLDLLAAYLDEKMPADLLPTINRQQSTVKPELSSDSPISLLSQQIQQLAQQVALLSGGTTTPSTVNRQPSTSSDVTPDELVELKKPFGATARIEKQAIRLTEKQQSFLDQFTRIYNKKTATSKKYTQQHRKYMSDPRVVTGFKPVTKEIVYPLVVNRSKGSHIWDLDENEYVDVLNGFGSNFFGYQPKFITDALKEQIDAGYELGPQHELAGPVCKLICEFTRFDRSALCNTGSEAVMGAMRIARTVTGRSLIVAFNGSYHGIMDEVIVRGTKKLKTFPAAPGIMANSVQNMLILDYGTEESLQIIRERGNEIAAVLVEPVQSRRPEYQPVEFLKELRKITTQSGSALVFDEVITGFRMHPGGIQSMFGISADIGTYGKVVAAGMPFGVIAGKKVWMDALDGGEWQFGDDSTPEAGVTYFAGTFVRHPLALAAAKASLEYMKAKGPSLQEGMNRNTKKLADAMNDICTRNGLPLYIAQFGSLWKIKWKDEIPYGELLFTLMRYKGVHIWDGFPCFLTEAHTEADIQFVIQQFEASINDLIGADFMVSQKPPEMGGRMQEEPPMPGARLGRDPQGNPAWFISDPSRPGKYKQLNRK
jgi:amino acid adenylation domain-containing protein